MALKKYRSKARHYLEVKRLLLRVAIDISLYNLTKEELILLKFAQEFYFANEFGLAFDVLDQIGKYSPDLDILRKKLGFKKVTRTQKIFDLLESVVADRLSYEEYTKDPLCYRKLTEILNALEYPVNFEKAIEVMQQLQVFDPNLTKAISLLNKKESNHDLHTS